MVIKCPCFGQVGSFCLLRLHPVLDSQTQGPNLLRGTTQKVTHLEKRGLVAFPPTHPQNSLASHRIKGRFVSGWPPAEGRALPEVLGARPTGLCNL